MVRVFLMEVFMDFFLNIVMMGAALSINLLLFTGIGFGMFKVYSRVQHEVEEHNHIVDLRLDLLTKKIGCLSEQSSRS